MRELNLNNAPLVLLDDSRPYHKAQPSLLFHSPERIIQADTFKQLSAAFQSIDEAVAQGYYVAGWIAYECMQYFEPTLAPLITEKAKEPLIWMMVTKHRVIVSPADVEALLHKADHGNARQAELQKGSPAQTEEEYVAALKTVHDYIVAGDVYQINHTLPIPVQLQGSATSLYRKLRQRQPVSYGAYIDTGTEKILSLSPELFLEKKASTLIARPMKGTAPRGRTRQEDISIQQALKDDAKSQAENLMIVDLIRNDLSRIGQAGSVTVPNLFEIEQYPTLHQMTSIVTATAHEGLRPSELLAGMFPCGSVTGAPKVRAMEIIQSLETAPRGVYCGTIGHFSPRTSLHEESWCLNVPIRTLILENTGAGRLSVGSGVVADSDPYSEYQECILKAAFTDKDPISFSLIETMHYCNGEIEQLPVHLNRMATSAVYFDFNYQQHRVETAIFDHIKTVTPTKEARRIRLLLGKHGATTVTSSIIESSNDETAQAPLSVCISGTQTFSGDPFLFHKTTHRSLYNQATIAAKDMGHADILFFNEKDELTEGAISNVFIKKDGILYTPPVDAGLLPGTLRARLLAEQSNVVEKTLSRDDLMTADTVYIGNALRGLRAVTLTPTVWHLSESQ